jgi:hypothetical protein
MAIAKAAVSAGLVVGGYPAGLLGLAPAQVGAVGEAGGDLSTAAVRAITGRKPGEIPPEEYQLVTGPARELPRRVAAAVRAISERRRAVVFLDTGEVLGDTAGSGLRRVMRSSRPRLVWVIGARFEAKAETGVAGPIEQFRCELGDENLALMSPARFDEAMVRSYLRARRLPRRPGRADRRVHEGAAACRQPHRHAPRPGPAGRRRLQADGRRPPQQRDRGPGAQLPRPRRETGRAANAGGSRPGEG